jgi:hypothetical protein
MTVPGVRGVELALVELPPFEAFEALASSSLWSIARAEVGRNGSKFLYEAAAA